MKKVRKLVGVAVMAGLGQVALMSSTANAGLAIGSALIVSGIFSQDNATTTVAEPVKVEIPDPNAPKGEEAKKEEVKPANSNVAVKTTHDGYSAWGVTALVTGSVVCAATLIGSIAIFATAPTGAGAAIGVGTLFFDTEVSRLIETELPFIESPEAKEFLALSKVELSKNFSDVVVLDADVVRSVMERGDYTDAQVERAVSVFAAN